MTKQDIRQKAEESADKIYPDLEDMSCREHYITGYIAGVNSMLIDNSPWISVEDRLPDKKKSDDGVELTESEEVFVRTEKVYYGKVYMYYGVAKCFYPTCGGHEWSVSDVTHWMPIPELEKRE